MAVKLFHVAFENHGASFHFVPHAPKTRAPREPARPHRVCVGPRVGDCLRLFPWLDNRNKVFVYQTEVKHLPKASYTLPRKYVPDWRKWTREEIWLLNKEGYDFERIGYIRMFRVEMLMRPCFWYWKRGGASYDVLDFSMINEASAPGHVSEEVRKHLEMRKFIKGIKEKGPRETATKHRAEVELLMNEVHPKVHEYKTPKRIYA